MNLKFLRKISLSLLFMLLASTILFAQDRKITGKVVDQADGQGIPGVNVSLKGVPSNVSTNSDGVYTIQVKSDADVLVFSFIGYVRQQVTIGKQTNIVVRLVPENKSLEDVVVVGYGTQKRSHLTGAVVDIKATEVEDLPASNIGAALAGKILGVGVSGGISRPGSTAKLTIRNPNTIFSKDGGSTDPLYVIDDVIQINPQNGQPDATLFNNLDPSEIESLSFLKDASAAIYGTRAGNGVVLVKTKRGKIGPPRISYSGSYAFNDEAYRTKMMSAYQFGMYYNIMNGPNGANVNPTGASAADSFFSQDELEHFKNINYDWLEDAWKSSYNMKHTLSISGGTDRATYFGDVAYYKQDGNLSSLDFKRWNFRSGADIKVATNLKVGLQVSGNNSELIKTFNKIGSELDDNDYRNLILAPRYVPMYINGYPVKLPGTTNDFSTYHFYEIEKLGNLANTRNTNFTINLNAQYDIPFVKGLSARAAYSRNMGSSNGSQIGTKYNVYTFKKLGTNEHIYDGATLPTALVASNGNRLYYSNTTQSSTQSNFVLTYNRSFGKHTIGALATVERSEQAFNNEVVFKADPIQQTNGQFNSATGAIDGSTTKSEGGSLSYVARANYSYADKYLAEFMFRSDASTKFAPGNYWGNFYSGSLGWVISEEDFFKVPGIDFLKLRYSIGLLGNDQTKAWLWRQRYTFQDGKGAVFGGDGNATAGYKMEASPNPDATWSDELKNNVGIDAKFLKNRLTLSLDGYYNHATNILTEVTSNIPITIGGSVASQNYATADYFGYELGIGWNDKIGKDFSYGVDFRFAWSDNKVIKADYNANDVLYPWNPRNGTSSDVGKWGYDYLGMFKDQQEIDAYLSQYKITSVNPGAAGSGSAVLAKDLKPGMLYYRDVRGPLQPDGSFAGPDGIIDFNDQVQLSKKATNHYGYGTTLKANYKGIGIEAVISGSFGGWSEIDARKKMNNSISRTFASVPEIWGDIYDPILNPTGTMPNPNWEATSLSPTSNFWKVSSFRMRLASIQLNYSLPKRWLEQVKVSNVRVYASALNPYNFYNPYSYRDSDTAYDVFPNLKTFSFGLNVTF